MTPTTTPPRGAVWIDDVRPGTKLYLASVLFDDGNEPAAAFGPGHFFKRQSDAKRWLRVAIHQQGEAPKLGVHDGQIAWWYGIVERVFATGDVTSPYEVDDTYDDDRVQNVYPAVPVTLRNAAQRAMEQDPARVRGPRP